MSDKFLGVFVLVALSLVLVIGFVPTPEDASANPCPDVELVEFDQLPEGPVGEVSGSCFPTGVLCVAPSYNSVIASDRGTYWCAFIPAPSTPTPVPATPPLTLPLNVPIPQFTG